jgi:calcium-binding protein CML
VKTPVNPERGSEPDQTSRYDRDDDVVEANVDVDVDVDVEVDDDDDDDKVLADAFEVFDANRDGRISAEELHAVLVQLGGIGGGPRAFGTATSASTSAPSTSLQECRRMIRAVDRNGAGYVDFHDFKRMMSMAIP